MRPPRDASRVRTYARASNSDFTFLLSPVSQRAKNERSIRPPIFQKQRVVCKSSTPFSFLTLQTTKIYFRWIFGGLTRRKSKQTFTNTYNKHNINLLHWTLWHLWQQKHKNFFYVCAHIRARGGKQDLLTQKNTPWKSIPNTILPIPFSFHLLPQM